MVEGGRRSTESDRLRHELKTQWQAVRVLFLAAPDRAVRFADDLVREALAKSGYPVGGPAAPPYDDMVHAYCAAHAVARASARGGATKDDLRRAMTHYGALMGDLLADAAADAPLSRDSSEPRSRTKVR